MTKVKVEVLGSGTSQGVPVIMCDCEVCTSTDKRDNRLRCAITIAHGDHNIVVDVGPDFRQQMLRCGLSKIDAVLLTHEHNDHIIGLDDLRPYNFKQKKDINVYASNRVLADIKNKFHYAFTKQTYPGAPGYKLHEIEHGSKWMLGDLEITAFEVMHGNLPILCYRFNDFVYVTDAKTLDSKSKEIIRGCDTLIVNALRNKEHWSHFTLVEALAFIEEMQPRQAYLTHMSHLLGKHKDVEAKLPANVKLCFDGMRFDV